jgi:arsenate reductase
MKILFLCVANSSRSQMAEGLARSFLANSNWVQSAGSSPTQLNPYAVQVMSEIGIDISSYRSKSVDEINPDSVDLVITLCAEEVCPSSFGNKKSLHWGLSDPAAVDGSEVEKIAAFRKVRDQIKKKLEELIA